MFDDPHWRRTSRVNVQLWGEALVNDRIRDSFLGDFATYRQLLAGAVGRAQQVGDLPSDLDPDVVAQVLWGITSAWRSRRPGTPNSTPIRTPRPRSP